jgi:hypothetical protein
VKFDLESIFCFVFDLFGLTLLFHLSIFLSLVQPSSITVGLSDSESDSSSLERKRGGGDAYKSNRKAQGQHKRRVPKKRVPIAVSTPKIPVGFDPNSSTGMNPAALMFQKLKNEINSSIEKGEFANIIEFFSFYFSLSLFMFQC